jgi:dienelactone hydrolase
VSPGHRFSVVRLVTALALLSALQDLPTAEPALVSWQAEVPATLVARAKDVVDRLVSGEVEPVVGMFNDKMKAAIDAARLRGLMPGVAVQAGAFKSQTGARSEVRGAYRVVIVSCAFERSNVDVQVVFDESDRIAGLSMRPQASTADYSPAPYVTRSAFRDVAVTVDAGGWPLPGTLSLPSGAGPFTAVVLVHGSGQHDRDETIGSNKPFRDLAWGLASRGIAVLRYEKRTRQHQQRVAQIQGSFTVKEEAIDDAVAAVAVLRNRPGIRADRIFVLGHSLGAMLAPRIAVADPRIAGLVLMAAPVRSIEQSVVDQVKYLANVDGTISPDEQTQIAMADALMAAVRDVKPGDPPIQTMFVSAPASYWLDLKGYSAPEASRTLPQPMLILQGERDYQVTMDDYAVWKQALGDGTSNRVVQYRSYPGLNHLFMPGTGPSTGAEYMQASHVDAAVIGDVAAWIQRRN